LSSGLPASSGKVRLPGEHDHLANGNSPAASIQVASCDDASRFHPRRRRPVTLLHLLYAKLDNDAISVSTNLVSQLEEFVRFFKIILINDLTRLFANQHVGFHKKNIEKSEKNKKKPIQFLHTDG
jgi:hypothetical protein